MKKQLLERLNKNINAEFEKFKCEIIKYLTPEEIFAKAYKINFFNELYDYLTYACETDEECDEFSEDELKVLLRFKENLIENLYIEFIDNDYFSINSYEEINDLIKYFIEKKESRIMKNRLDNLNKKAITYLANAIILLEEQEYTKEDIIDKIGISSKEYEYVMSGGLRDGDIIFCSDCKKEFVYNKDETISYKNEPICEKCYDLKYGWCDQCDSIFKYQELFIQGEWGIAYCSDCCDKMGLEKNEKFCD